MRIDMTASEWHKLVKPVLPHTIKDTEFPELGHVRIEIGASSLYAVASDRYTLGVERRPLARIDRNDPQPPVHIPAGDIKASLTLFKYAKDDDPDLAVTIDTVRVPSQVMGQDGSYSVMAVTLTSDSGAKMVLHDHRMPNRDPLAGWQKTVAAAVSRAQGGTPAGLDLNPDHLGRWTPAVRAGERLTFWTGPRRKSPVLVTVEDHFAGVWMPWTWQPSDSGGDYPAPPASAGLPWLAELDSRDIDPDTGELAAT